MSLATLQGLTQYHTLCGWILYSIFHRPNVNICGAGEGLVDYPEAFKYKTRKNVNKGAL